MAALLVPATSASAALYSVTDIGTLGGQTSEATAINEFGEITGSAATNLPAPPGHSAPAAQAFRYRDGVMTRLSHEEAPNFSKGEAINDRGDIAGWAVSDAGVPSPLLFKANGSILEVPCSECAEPVAYGVNDADEVVGGSPLIGHVTAAWLTNSEGKETNFGGGPCTFAEEVAGGEAFAINDRGQVVGKTQIGGCFLAPFHAFLYSRGTLHDLGILGGNYSAATALNELGTVVGSSTIGPACTSLDCPRATHAFSYRNGKMSDLGTLPGSKESLAKAINDFGQIVGTSAESIEEHRPEGVRAPGGHAFLYFFGRMIDLNTLIPTNSGWTLTTANGINDLGEIVGTGLHNGVERGFILKPSLLWF